MRPNAQSTLMETYTTIRLHRQHLPTTMKMVEEAIIALNSRRGFSLYKLKKYICEKYHIELNPKRINLIKNQLRALLSNGTLKNVTGKGLIGSMRIESKKKKSHIIATEMQQSGVGHVSVHATFIATKRKKGAGKSESVNLRSHSQARTPPNIIVQPLIPHAPHRNSITGRSHLEEGATPRSSGGRVGRKRKLLPPPEDYIMISQEY